MKSFVWSQILFAFLLLSGAVFAAGAVEEDSFPDGPVRIIVPYARNGGTDEIARTLARTAEKYFGQPLIVENIVGGSGAAGMIAGAAAVPDGYTVTMVTRELVSLSIVGVADISRDDFKLLGLVNLDPAVLAVKADSQFEDLNAIVDLAREAPGRIRFASAAKPHFYILEFERKFNLNFNKIPYNGAAQAIPAVLDGQADFTLANPGELREWLARGEVRVLAVMADSRLATLPGVPTFGELGFPISSHTWRGLAVPAATPDIRRTRLEALFAMAAADEEFTAQLRDRLYSHAYLNADEFADFIERDRMMIANIVRGLTVKEGENP